jgi:uncharacterized protein YybS (DUF2232 family)
MSLSAQAREREVRGAGVVTAALLSALLFSAWLFVPLLLPLSTLAPLPLTLQRLMRGWFAALSVAVLAALLVASAFSGEWALRYALFFAVPGLLIGGQMARGRGLLRGCLLAFLWLSALIGLKLLAAGPEIASTMLKPFEQVRSREFLDGIRHSGMPAERVDDIAEQFRTMHSVMKVVYPATLFILAALMVLANATLLRLYLARRDPGWLDGGEFETLRWPLALAVAFVVSGALLVVPALQSVGYNGLLLVAFFFALQGLAVVAFYAHRLAGPPFLRVAVVVLVLVNPWAPQILALLGLFDTWFDFRKWAELPPPAADGR